MRCLVAARIICIDRYIQICARGLAAVMERGSGRFSATTGTERAFDAPGPGDRLTSLLQVSAEAVHARPRFLRLFVVLLLGSEGDPPNRSSDLPQGTCTIWRYIFLRNSK